VVVDSFGQLVRVDTGIDLTGNSGLHIHFEKPEGTVVTVSSGDGVADTGTPTDGIIEYTVETAQNIFDTVGVVKVSARVQFAAGDLYSEPPAQIRVYPQFEN
jgi:hypothetical protein